MILKVPSASTWNRIPSSRIYWDSVRARDFSSVGNTRLQEFGYLSQIGIFPLHGLEALFLGCGNICGCNDPKGDIFTCTLIMQAEVTGTGHLHLSFSSQSGRVSQCPTLGLPSPTVLASPRVVGCSARTLMPRDQCTPCSDAHTGSGGSTSQPIPLPPPICDAIILFMSLQTLTGVCYGSTSECWASTAPRPNLSPKETGGKANRGAEVSSCFNFSKAVWQ